MIATKTIDWTKIGAEYNATDEQKAKILEYVERFDWLKVESGLEVAMMPGMDIMAAIEQLSLPKVSHVAISNDMAPCALYGIRCHYRQGEVDVLLIDEGHQLIPLAQMRDF